MEKYVLGIDIGTTSVKAVLISSVGKIIAEANRAHDLMSPHANWAEEDADIWWENTILAVQDLENQKPEELQQVCCIGCSGMVPAIVMLDENGRPIRNTIQQNDARAIKQIADVANAIDQDELYARTGGRTNQQHILPRLLWVKENEPEVWSKCRTVMGSYDYIVYKLSGTHSLEMNWAVESGSFDIHKRCWIEAYLEPFGLSEKLFPPVNESMQIVAKSLPEMQQVMGLPGGVPIIAGSADHVASTLAAGIIDEGDLLIKFGGAGDILYCTRTLQTSPQLFIDYHDVPGTYLINGCMAASGSLVKWFTKDIMQSDDPAILRQMDLEAEKLRPASDGLIILPYFLGEKTPLFDPEAKGVLCGLTLSHTRAHVFRAVLEAVIYGFRHHIEVLKDMGLTPTHIMATNGGSKSRFWCQIAADVLGASIKAYPSHPGSALGVAFMAGLSVGAFRKWEDINLFLTDYRTFTPNEEAARVYDRAYAIYRDLYRQLKPSFGALNELYDGYCSSENTK